MGRKNKAALMREKLLESLFECLADGGHEKVTMKAIALKAGVLPGVLHYYFVSKDEMIIQMTQGMVAHYSQILAAEISGATTRAEKIKALAGFLTDQFIFDARLNRVFYNLIQMNLERPELNTALGSLMDAYRERVEKALAQASMDAAEAKKLAPMLVALTEGFALQWMIDPKHLKREEIGEMILAAIKGVWPGQGGKA